MNLHKNQCGQPKHEIDAADWQGRGGSWREGRKREGGRRGEKRVGWRSSLKSAGVGRSPPELGHAGELRSGQRGRGNRGVKLVDVVMERCYRELGQQGVGKLVPTDSFGLKLLFSCKKLSNIQFPQN